MDRGAWWATVHGVAKNWTRLSNEVWHRITHRAYKHSQDRVRELKCHIPYDACLRLRLVQDTEDRFLNNTSPHHKLATSYLNNSSRILLREKRKKNKCRPGNSC